MKNDAIKLWLKHHIIGDGWVPTAGKVQKNGLPVVLLYNDKDTYHYSVQYAGNGHYFKTKYEALEYIYGRGWKWEGENNNAKKR